MFLKGARRLEGSSPCGVALPQPVFVTLLVARARLGSIAAGTFALQ
jgi:hypothetical protein